LGNFFDAHNLAWAAVIGHSLGGKVAMQFALTHPGKVQKLVVVDMAPRIYPPVHEQIFASLLALDLKTFQTRQEIEAALEPVIPSLVVRRFLLKNVGRNSDGGLHWKMNLRGLEENYSRLGEALTAAAPFEKPALFVRGGKSDYVRDEDELLIRGLFPNAEIKTIAQAGHWVHGDAPDEFAGCVLNFLTPV
jgi:pimeloyl-ACP methyl ester carboxylesterase